MIVYETRAGGAIKQHHKTVKNMIFTAGRGYATVWNQATLSQTQVVKADLVIPVAKKDAQVKDLEANLQPFATAFGVEVSLMTSVAQEIDALVKQAVTPAPKEATSKKGKAKANAPSPSSNSPTSFPPTPQFPPDTHSPWITITAQELLRRAPQWVLSVRPSESATLKYAIVFELFSILAHRRYFIEKTVAGNAVRILFQNLLKEHLVKEDGEYIFADGLGTTTPMTPQQLDIAKKHQRDEVWGRRMASFMTRLSRVNLSLTGVQSDESDEEDDKEQALESFIKSRMVDVMKVSSPNTCYIRLSSQVFCRRSHPTCSSFTLSATT
jgi:hypothetical protein